MERRHEQDAYVDRCDYCDRFDIEWMHECDRHKTRFCRGCYCAECLEEMPRMITRDIRMNNTDLSRAVAEKLGWYVFRDDTTPPIWFREDTKTMPINHSDMPDYATDWSLIGPEIEKRKISFHPSRIGWVAHTDKYAVEAETLPRAACLAILEE